MPLCFDLSTIKESLKDILVGRVGEEVLTIIEWGYPMVLGGKGVAHVLFLDDGIWVKKTGGSGWGETQLQSVKMNYISTLQGSPYAQKFSQK